MYVPRAFAENDIKALHQQMQGTPLAVLATYTDTGLIASHVPLLLNPDEGANGTLYFGTGTGSLYAVDSQGGFKTLATGWPGIRGVAVDNANRRLFAAVGAVQADGPSSIRIVPLD